MIQPMCANLGQVSMIEKKGEVSMRSVKHWECWDHLDSSFSLSNTSLCCYLVANRQHVIHKTMAFKNIKVLCLFSYTVSMSV